MAATVEFVSDRGIFKVLITPSPGGLFDRLVGSGKRPTYYQFNPHALMLEYKINGLTLEQSTERVKRDYEAMWDEATKLVESSGPPKPRNERDPRWNEVDYRQPTEDEIYATMKSLLAARVAELEKARNERHKTSQTGLDGKPVALSTPVIARDHTRGI